MAKKATYKLFNGTAFDEIHFKTSIEQVDGLEDLLSDIPDAGNFVQRTGAETISGIKTFNDGIIIPGSNKYIDLGNKNNWFWTRFSGENWTFNNAFTGGGWARNLMEMKDSAEPIANTYFRIGAQGNGQNFSQMYIGPAYNNYWLSLNNDRALFGAKPQYAGNPTVNNDLTRKFYVDTTIANHKPAWSDVSGKPTNMGGSVIASAANDPAGNTTRFVTPWDLKDGITKVADAQGYLKSAQVVQATTENKNILGTTESVFNIKDKKVWFNKGALFYGTAADAGLVTRGISGTNSTGSAKDHLYINYDGNNTLSRQLVLGAGSIGTSRGNGIYDYSAVRGDALIAYLNGTLGSYLKNSDISAWAKIGNSDTIPTSKLPALAITDTFEVATQSAMTNLTAQKGDIAIRTDLNKTFILAAEPASTLGNWKELKTPTDAVLSVAGLTGAITSSSLKTSLSLNNVNNTSDANKPISTAVATALAGKVDKDGDKGLSTNDYTTNDKSKLSGIIAGAQPNRAIANEAQAQDGTDNTTVMTPLRVKQAISALGGEDYVLTKPKIDTALNGNGNNSIQLGPNASAGGAWSTALGFNTSASSSSSTALGSGANASGLDSTSLGFGSSASGISSIALGRSAKAEVLNSTALGVSANAEGDNSTALGAVANASGEFSTALGHAASATGVGAIALGLGATAAGSSGSIALGVSARAEGHNSIAFGADTVVTENNVVDFGLARQVRVKETPVSDRDAVSKKYLENVISSIGGGGTLEIATPAQAQAGTDNTTVMTPLRVKEVLTESQTLNLGTESNDGDVNIGKLNGYGPAISIVGENDSVVMRGDWNLLEGTMIGASGSWRLVHHGPSEILSKYGYTALTLNETTTYYNKPMMMEIRYGNNQTTLTNQIVTFNVGTSSSTVVSKTHPRTVSITDFDGRYLKTISVKAYVTTTGVTSSLRVGPVKTLIGDFTGSAGTLTWTTEDEDNISVYIGKIWVMD